MPPTRAAGRFTDSTGDHVGGVPGDREHLVRARIEHYPDRRVTNPFGDHLRMNPVPVVCAAMLPCVGLCLLVLCTWCAPGSCEFVTKNTENPR